jgi:hypothetical protein
MLQRRWGSLSAKEGGRGIHPRTVNKQSGTDWRGSRGNQGHTPSNQEQESL